MVKLCLMKKKKGSKNWLELKMEIICVGNELLIGKTLNTNANWLAKRATSLGISVKRISTVRDTIHEIKEIVREALNRKPRFVIITGGLGPTHDDKTLAGVAEALNRKLVVDDRALNMVRAKYEALLRVGRIETIELTPARVKMATIPEGAMLMPNPVGTAPGVRLKLDDCLLIVLPGVPTEMKAIFQESVTPLIMAISGDLKFFEKSIYVSGIIESALAPLIDLVMRENPYVYIKSHPKGAENKLYIELHLSTKVPNSKTAEQYLNNAGRQILNLIKKDA